MTTRDATARHPQTGRPYGRRQSGVYYSSVPATSRHLRDAVDGEVMIHRDRGAAYQVGQTVTVRGYEGVWTVIACGSHRISDWEDDTREGQTVYDAIVRPATSDEAEAHDRSVKS